MLGGVMVVPLSLLRGCNKLFSAGWAAPGAGN